MFQNSQYTIYSDDYQPVGAVVGDIVGAVVGNAVGDTLGGTAVTG